MRFIYGKKDWADRERGQENCYLLTNGLGGFSSASMINSNTRNDHALLMASLEPPNARYNIVNRLEEALDGVGEAESVGEPEPAGVGRGGSGKRKGLSGEIYLSSQEFADPGRNEDGYRVLNSFVFEDYPEWTFQAGGVEIVKRLAMKQGMNLVAVEYQIDNRTDREVCLTVTPHLQFAPKGKEPEGEVGFITGRKEAGGEAEFITGRNPGGPNLFFRTNGDMETFPPRFCEGMFYSCDARDGRCCLGRTCVNHRIRKLVPAHEKGMLEVIYLAVLSSDEKGSTEGTEEKLRVSAETVFREAAEYRRGLREAACGYGGIRGGGFRDETALQLAVSAGQFIAERASTGGKTILAGYPFFEDWGRDTMIALEGCCMATGQLDTAASILRTFARYCLNGLMPNLFPEGGRKPLYNTADASLLFINSVYGYYIRTKDEDFVREMWPVMTEIIDAYRNGTDFGIHMDGDGLIMAGRELDQVTWMDVRIGDYLPTPRHGKPVEINAYWYNALRAMERMSGEVGITETDRNRRSVPEENAGCDSVPEEDAGCDSVPEEDAGCDYGSLADKARGSFREKFWIEDKGYLRDVISDDGGPAAQRAEEQFRCNQIWALSMPFTMLDRDQELQIIDLVYEKLYTPLGLRTLDREDGDFHGFYGGPAGERDRAYHQGTVWVFPLGAFYLAYLRTRDYSECACAQVRRWLDSLESALREGCVGQLPEIYDGENPTFSRGCFAQAWSVGEMLRVYEELERHRW